MTQGNPNPSPDTRFKPGQSGNPGGKSSEHRKAEIRAAEKAALVQADLVDALAGAMASAEGDLDKLAYLTKEVNALMKNAQDRGFGAPQVHVDNTSSDGSHAMPTQIVVKGAPKTAPESD